MTKKHIFSEHQKMILLGIYIVNMSWSEIVLDLRCSLQPLTALAIRKGEDTDTEKDHVACGRDGACLG